MKEDRIIRILVVDDHFLVRMGLVGTLQMEDDLKVVGEAETGGRAIELYDELRPDVVLMDLALPDMTGIEAMEAILRVHPKARVVILSTYEGDEFISRALRAHAASYLLKSMPREELIQSIRQVLTVKTWIPPCIARILAGRPYGQDLTERERQIVSQLVKGMSNKEIAYRLSITEGTVKLHLNSAFEKLDVKSRAEAAVVAIRRGLVDPE